MPDAVIAVRNVTGYIGDPPAPNLIPEAMREDFSDAGWDPQDISRAVVTVDANLDPYGNLTADTLEDDSNSLQMRLFTADAIIPDDGSARYYASVFVGKDAIDNTVRCFGIAMDMGGGEEVTIWLDTSDGTVWSLQDTPDDYGAENYDANWWRLYVALTHAGVSTGISVTIHPAPGNIVGGNPTPDGASQGESATWGVMLTQSDTLENYVPNP